jgi:VWFA-related protein
MTPADLVAIATYASSLRIAQDFTNDRDALAKALQGIRVGEESSALSEAGSQGEAGAMNAAGEEVVARDVSAAFTPDETEFNIFNTDQKLAAVESLARLLREVPGRKAVIHFSSGVESTGSENQAQLRATTDAANRSNVSLYTVDARGLVALPPGGDASSASAAGTAIYTGQATFSQISSLHGSRETLASLATDTGGRTFYDLNDFSPAFQQMQAENSSYYLLGYSPSNTRSDGRFRRIRVEVVRAGVKVAARPGYFAPKDFRQFTREDKELQLQQALELDQPFLDLPFAVDSAYFRRPDKKYYVVLAAKIPGSAISFLRKSGTRQTEFDFAWSAMDAAKRPVNFLRDTLPVKLSDEAYGQLLSSNILYQGGMTLPPGQYRLKVVVRENQSGKLGTFEQALSLPEITDTGLALSSIVLSNQLQEATSGSAKAGKSKKASESPLQVGDKLVLPSVTRVFRTNQTLCFYLESYADKTATPLNAPATPSAPAVPPSVGLAFFRGGAKVAESGPYAGKAEKTAAGKTSYFAQMPLEKFPPGRYLMQVNVLDPGAGRVAFRRVPMAVVKPPQPTPAPAPGS